MLADGGLGQAQAVPDMPDVAAAAGETGDDLQPYRVAKRLEKRRRWIPGSGRWMYARTHIWHCIAKYREGPSRLLPPTPRSAMMDFA